MKTTIFIPKRISVGFQHRDNTYTGRLAYVTYFDEKGVLRKEKSWNGWRDENIEPIVTDNEPTSGFVLNKKVGGYDTGWSHRQTYCRVYDPRGFEFEITIPNLLYILENTNSIKGKGLEGDFVYGWDGKDLALIPTSSPDYAELMAYNEILQKKEYVKSKDLVLGGTYRTKDDENYIYLGRFDYHDEKSKRVYYGSGNYDYNWVYESVNKGKHYFFAHVELNTHYDKPRLNLLIIKSLGSKFIETISSECVDNYAELYTLLEERKEFSPHDPAKDEYIPYTLEEFKEQESKIHWSQLEFFTKVDNEYIVKNLYYNLSDKTFYEYGDWRKVNYWNSEREKILIGDGSIEAVFNQYKPVYRNEYLANGKFYRKVER